MDEIVREGHAKIERSTRQVAGLTDPGHHLSIIVYDELPDKVPPG
jgi:hypothetical protein